MITKLLSTVKPILLLVSVSYTILLLYLCLKSGGGSSNLPEHTDKVFHAIAHLGFVLTWYVTLSLTFNYNKVKALLNAIVYSIAFGVLIELLQALLPTGRSADMLDVLANIFGAIIAVLIINITPLAVIKKQ